MSRLGGTLGLTIPMDMPERFAGLVVMNTAMPTGGPISDGFAVWKQFASMAPEIPVAGLLATDAREAMDIMDALAYDAPFPDNSYKAVVRRFPQIVPVEPDMDGVELCRRARNFLAHDWEGQSAMAIGMRDSVLGESVMDELRRTIEGCPEPMKLESAGHFVQEYGVPVAEAALDQFGLR